MIAKFFPHKCITFIGCFGSSLFQQHDTSKSPNKRIRLHSLTKSNTIVLSDGSSSDTDDNGCDEAWQPENNALDGTGSEDSDSSGRKQVSNYALDVGSKVRC